MDDKELKQDEGAQGELLARELDEAELFVQRLRASIAAIRDQLVAGHIGRALSMCNEALTEIDSATDVVAPSPYGGQDAAFQADFTAKGGKG
jgi:hypothetical protein